MLGMDFVYIWMEERSWTLGFLVAAEEAEQEAVLVEEEEEEKEAVKVAEEREDEGERGGEEGWKEEKP